MSLSSKDIIITFVSCAVIASASAGLYYDYRARIRTTQTDVIGTITFKKETAERKYTDQMIWEELSREAPVYNNDSIRTADGSAAVVRLKNGTNIDLDENTLVMFSFTSKGADIDLAGGSIFAKTAEAAGGKAQAVNLRSGGTAVSVTSGSLNLTKKLNASVDLSVTAGTAQMTGAAGPISVGPNQAVTIEGGKAEVRKNTVEPTSPEPNAYIVTSAGSRTSIIFSWKGSLSKTLKIASDRGFTKNPFKKNITNGSQETFSKGDYYWRIYGTDGSSEVRKFSVLEDPVIMPISPKNGTQLSYTAGSPLVQLSWSPSAYASSFEVEISRNAQFTDKPLRLNPLSSSIATDQLQEGNYYWHVRPVYGVMQKTNFSPSSSFSIVQLKKALPPQTIHPAMNSVKSESAAARVSFSWTGSSDFKDYILELSRDSSFTSTLLNETVAAYYYHYKQNMPAGDYFWRVKGRSAQGVLSDPSPSVKFTVVKNRPPGSLSAFPESAASTLLTWKDPDGTGRYRVEIARDAAFIDKILSAEYTVPSASVKDLAQGDYFFSVTSLESSGVISAVSQIQRFSVAGMLDQPAVISPANNSSVDVIRTRSIDFAWKPVPLAQMYLLEIYQYSFTANRLMFSIETQDTWYAMKQLSSLANGNFYWQVSSLRKKDNVVTARSMPSKGYFNIPSGPELKAPKIGNLKIYVE